MTEPYSRGCPGCGWINGHALNCVFRQAPPNSVTRTLLAAYVDLRADCIAIEELIADDSTPSDLLSADDLKRLDKAVTVMKVGFKMIKKVLRSRGVCGRIKPDPVQALVEADSQGGEKA